jgi:hypothetical protein
VGGEALVVGEGDDRRCHPRSARSSARATAVRFRNVCGGDAGADVGEAARRQRGGAPDHEVRGAERGVLADQDLTRVHDAVDHAVDVGVGDGHLEVLGCVPVGDVDRGVEVVDEHAATVRAERGPGRLGACLGQVGELPVELGVGGRGEVDAWW